MKSKALVDLWMFWKTKYRDILVSLKWILRKGQETETTSEMSGESSIQTEVTALLIPRAHDAVFIPGAQQAKRQSNNMQGTNPNGSTIWISVQWAFVSSSGEMKKIKSKKKEWNLLWPLKTALGERQCKNKLKQLPKDLQSFESAVGRHWSSLLKFYFTL